MASYATERKIRIIRERLGAEWETQTAGRSIDSVYNEVVGDVRKNLFCKLSPESKARLDEMVDEYDIKMADFVEHLIRNEYERFQSSQSVIQQELAQRYSNPPRG